MRYLVLIYAAILLTSCRKEAPIDNVFVPDGNEYPANLNPERQKEEFEILIDKFTKKRKAVELRLDSLSPDEANALYDSYISESAAQIIEIEKTEEKFINSYFNDFYNRNKSIPDSVSIKINLLDRAGLEIWDIGEGMFELRAIPEFYLRIFEKHVTADYREYMTLLAEDDKVLFDNDAALNIPLDDVAKRVLNWENFVEKYPHSKIIAAAKENYRYYQQAFLLGADNTPSIAYETSELDPYFKEEFIAFSKKHPTSFTTKLINIALGHKGDTSSLAELIEQEQSKYFKL